jgi:hypothetical protein
MPALYYKLSSQALITLFLCHFFSLEEQSGLLGKATATWFWKGGIDMESSLKIYFDIRLLLSRDN